MRLDQVVPYRQYFEKSTTETAFIGYSSETTALTIRQATDEIKSRGRLETADSPPTQQSMLVDSELSDDEDMAVDGDVEEFWEQVTGHVLHIIIISVYILNFNRFQQGLYNELMR